MNLTPSIDYNDCCASWAPDSGKLVFQRDADNGGGFSRPAAERFSPFATTRASGLGLGLSISRTIIESHGGRIWTEDRDGEFPFMEHVEQTTPDGVAADTAAAVAHLRSPAGGGTERVYTVGFCFGGRHSFNQAARGHGLHGVIGFYGVPQQRSPEDANAPVVLAPSYACKVLGLFGGEDLVITQEHIDAFGRALDDATVENTLVTYQNSPHSFFDRSFDEHKDACDDAWRRMLAFVGSGG